MRRSAAPAALVAAGGLAPGGALAQQIAGSVVDAETGDAVPGVEVAVEGRNPYLQAEGYYRRMDRIAVRATLRLQTGAAD